MLGAGGVGLIGVAFLTAGAAITFSKDEAISRTRATTRATTRVVTIIIIIVITTAGTTFALALMSGFNQIASDGSRFILSENSVELGVITLQIFWKEAIVSNLHILENLDDELVLGGDELSNSRFGEVIDEIHSNPRTKNKLEIILVTFDGEIISNLGRVFGIVV